MKVFIFVMLLSSPAVAITGTCKVEICNKLERFTLNPFKHLKDKFGENCFDSIVGKEDAVVGKILDAKTKWYQGGFNPTKKSVTRIKRIISCD